MAFMAQDIFINFIMVMRMKYPPYVTAENEIDV